jgi:hypothetical protein
MDESGMFVKPTLSWTWLTVTSKCLGLGGMPSPSALGLACLPDLHYFILLGVPRKDDRYLGLG